MIARRIVAVATEVADVARLSGKDMHFGFPTFTGPAGEGLPCRHCLQWIAEGEERATLFTLDPFAGLESLPLPGRYMFMGMAAHAIRRMGRCRRI